MTTKRSNRRIETDQAIARDMNWSLGCGATVGMFVVIALIIYLLTL